MCDSCTMLAAEILIDELTAELIHSDFADGLTPEGVTRELTDNERRAKVNFRDIEEQLDAALLVLVPGITLLHETVTESIMSELFGDATVLPTATVAERVRALVVSAPPESVAEVAAVFGELVAADMATIYEGSAGLVAAEAVRQGVKESAVPARPALVVATVAPAAAAVAAKPWQRLTAAVDSALSSPALMVKETMSSDVVGGVLAGVKIDGTTDLAKQALNTAQGMGRNDMAAELAPSDIWASEILDRKVCGPCSRVDGTEYATLEEAREDYPLGQYVNCQGYSRCRGTLVFMFKDS